MREGRRRITTALASRLARAQYPRLARRPLRPVQPQGWDNATFRLGPALAVRMPTAQRYAGQVATEHRWLPHLSPHLPVAVPETLALGRPGAGYPFAWSIRCWIPGRLPGPGAGSDEALAAALAEALAALRAAPTEDGPPPGAANFHRGAPPVAYAGQVDASLTLLGNRIDAPALRSLWQSACGCDWTGSPVWLHGDIAPSNLVVDGAGRLAGLIDFGQMAVGDPACDLAIAWSFFTGAARTRFRQETGLDSATWARARGWALWKALLVMAGKNHRPPLTRPPETILADLTAEHGSDVG